MADQGVMNHIKVLAKEEQDLFSKTDKSAEERQRLDQIKVELDQCWDLLRQRRAKEEFGEDPDEAQVRGEDTVENYEQ